ncbi:MAG: hypothetical protein K8U03_16520 [Planctomycetia bacterium]|nr:hypothetical protein [Planctomycetia bacterium]
MPEEVMPEEVSRAQILPPKAWPLWSGVAGLIVLHLVLANGAAWNKCATFDEGSHIANAYSIAATGDYRMFPVAIAQQRWMTLPLVLQGVPAPATDQATWWYSDNWGYARQLLYEMGNDGTSILRWTRWMTSLLSAALALIVFCWSRKLFGTAGGFVSLLLYVLNPVTLSNGALATLDMSAALAFTGAMGTLWRVLQRLTYGRLALSSLVWGLAFCAKFSALLLIPMGLVLVAARIADGRPWDVQLGKPRVVTTRLRIFALSGLVMLAHIVGVWLTIWALFGFQFQTFRDYPNDLKQIYTGTFEQVAEQAVRYTGLLNFARSYHLFPEGYLYCFAETMRTTVGRASYLDGWFGIFGFRSFFPLAFFYKTPLAVFGLFLLGVAAHAARRLHQMRVEKRRAGSLLWEGAYATLPLVVLIVVYGGVSIFSGINIGIRHILPIFAPLFILSGLAGEWITAGARRFAGQRNSPLAQAAATDVEVAPPAGWPSCPDGFLRAMYGAVFAMLGVLVLETVAVFPNYLSYFNVASGGTQNGYKHLVDSSLDWGQDLPALKEWLDQEGLIGGENGPRIYLSYFGTTPPSSVGLKMQTLTEHGVTLLPGFFDRQSLESTLRQPFEPSLSDGVYCISATMLQTVYLPPFSGPWLESYEQNYRKILPYIAEFERSGADPKRRAAILEKYGAQLLKVTADFELLRLGRLCAYLRNREPVHIVNGSILVYRLSADDLNGAFSQDLAEKPRPNPTTYGEPVQY